jgi:outer membrane protein assembly factor BamE (lipoprotein component of BamABCDE complex)
MGARSIRLKTVFRGMVMLLALGAMTACSATIRKHGYVPPDEQLAEVVVGVDTRDSVAETLGLPSSSGVLNDGGYYYVSTRMRHYGAAEPKPVSRDLVAVNFDKNGVVTGVQKFGLEDGRVIPLQRRVTSSSIEDKTFLRQLIGNLGNFGPGALLEQ